VGSVAKLPLLLAASNASGINNLQEMMRAARERPGALSYASAGPASMHNLTGEYMKSLLKLDIAHVPYKGVAQILPDVIAGRVPLMFGGVSGSAPFVRDRQIRAIGVTSPKRSQALPDVPTLAEQGMPGFDSQGWVGMYAPLGVPAPMLAKMGAALRAALKERAVIQQEEVRGGNELLAGTVEELAALAVADYARWGKVIREQGIRVD
jgi:tripartite-type tricarboxylate transporter receptor subunit TctC